MINLLIIILYQQRVSSQAERSLLIYMIFVLILITTLLVLFFIFFQKRKNKLLIDKFKQQQAFENELLNAQTEIQEQTLKSVGWELHDNVGQLLAAASMQLNILKTQINNDLLDNFKEVQGTVKESLKEVRQLSSSLNNEVILNNGFEKSVLNELNRINRMKFTEAQFHVEGETIAFKNKKHEVIIFRIIQEFFSNSIKHAEANTLNVNLFYLEKKLKIIISDNGKGFNVNTVKNGSGLLNMKSRAALINTEFNLSSVVGEGAKLMLEYPYN